MVFVTRVAGRGSGAVFVIVVAEVNGYHVVVTGSGVILVTGRGCYFIYSSIHLYIYLFIYIFIY